MPEQLFSLLAAPTVAIVGDRWHTGYAQEVTFALASELARAGDHWRARRRGRAGARHRARGAEDVRAAAGRGLPRLLCAGRAGL